MVSRSSSRLKTGVRVQQLHLINGSLVYFTYFSTTIIILEQLVSAFSIVDTTNCVQTCCGVTITQAQCVYTTIEHSNQENDVFDCT